VGEVEEDEAAHMAQILHALDRVVRQAQELEAQLLVQVLDARQAVIL
jgi:regulator of sigma D